MSIGISGTGCYIPSITTQNKDFEITSSLKGYLKRSARNIWLSADKSEKALKAREELVGNNAVLIQYPKVIDGAQCIIDVLKIIQIEV